MEFLFMNILKCSANIEYYLRSLRNVTHFLSLSKKEQKEE